MGDSVCKQAVPTLSKWQGTTKEHEQLLVLVRALGRCSWGTGYKAEPSFKKTHLAVPARIVFDGHLSACYAVAARLQQKVRKG